MVNFRAVQHLPQKRPSDRASKITADFVSWAFLPRQNQRPNLCEIASDIGIFFDGNSRFTGACLLPCGEPT